MTFSLFYLLRSFFSSLSSFVSLSFIFFFFNDTATTEIYTLSLHDALPICSTSPGWSPARCIPNGAGTTRSEEHTSELQSQSNLVCRLLLEKKKKQQIYLLPHTKKATAEQSEKKSRTQ